MRVTAIINLKGGVAKTTTVINLAAILNQDYGKRVLLIDGDSQCNLSEFFGADGTKGSVSNVLRRSGAQHNPGEYAAQQIQSTKYNHLDILAADDTLMDLDLTKFKAGDVLNAHSLLYLKNAVQDMYDVILIDCPPAFNAASAAALIAADDCIIPIKLDAFSLRGMGNLMRQIANMRKINPGLQIAGVLPTLWYNSPDIRQCENQLTAAGLRVYPHIRQSRTVDRMTHQQEPLCIASPRSGAGADYRRFAEAYIKEGKWYGL